MAKSQFAVRNLEGDILRENFLIAAVVSIIVIRIFLALTDYPQLGGANFHIAHMIWGGFLMMGAILILTSYLNKAASNIAAVIGGIGFGTFIDELGKFVTKDNNYFFQPTIAIIYVIFILIYLIARFIPKYKDVTSTEYLVNAVEFLKEAIINDLDRNEKTKALQFINNSDENDDVTKALKKVIEEVNAIPPTQGPISRMRQRAREIYLTLAKSKIIVNTIVAALAVQAAITVFFTVNVLIDRPQLTFDEWGKLLSALLSVVFVVVGLAMFPRSRLSTFRFLKLAVLISIFLTQFFVFYQTQLFALINLIANIFVLLIIDFAIFEEQDRNNNGKIDLREKDAISIF
jgi:hypothetical protein